ncbi:putative esterase of the alpha-beta hydrolase superfamily [Solitalea canadensis DSM 3403]|uniref:Putative esterase of the alpha-beta hydrolase superfamily n=2 Tax=Solitalea canadensis TaxID=995 RepID=H8KWW9_SOLCM|nr:putative esterase of the alpha-beta hydrolase superfamily [Solitalea canadensis DSM 3403]
MTHEQYIMKIGLVMSGGGIRGIAHLGVVKALYEEGLTFSKISGTSAGAIVGAFLANGYQPDFILNAFKVTSLFRYIKPVIKGFGLLSLQNTSILYDQFLPATFEELKIPFVVAATDLGNARIAYFSSGKLIAPVQASSCIPAVFKPIEMDGKLYVDGGILDNFPVEVIMDDCDFIIGSCCNHLEKIDSVTGIKNIIERSVVISLNSRTESKKRLCNVIIEPKGLGSISLFHVKRTDDIFEQGYKAAKEEIKNNPELKEAIKNFKELQLAK